MKVVGAKGEADRGGEGRSRIECEAKPAGAVQRDVALLEEQSLLWVHRGRLGGRHAKAAVVEPLGARDEAAVARRHLKADIVGPPLRGHEANRVSRCR